MGHTFLLLILHRQKCHLALPNCKGPAKCGAPQIQGGKEKPWNAYPEDKLPFKEIAEEERRAEGRWGRCAGRRQITLKIFLKCGVLLFYDAVVLRLL